ncbi:hypothetical protein XENTR_v10022515 [Xenopus tropicalis]|nr:hypothetical protein XENTR_v10022515 [Xenopus tropicalis]
MEHMSGRYTNRRPFPLTLGSHTLHYDVTIVSAPTPGVPRYLVSMYVDGVQYGKYNSDIRHAEALYPSLRALSEHIERQTQYAQEHEMRQRHRLNFLKGYLNTKGKCKIPCIST